MREGMAAARSGKIDDDFNIAGLVGKRQSPLLDRNAARNQPAEPTLVRPRQGRDGVFIVLAVAIAAAEYGVVVEHHGTIDAADVDFERMARRGNTEQADDAAGRGA